MAVEQQQGLTETLKAKRSPKASGAKVIGRLEAGAGLTGVVEVTNARVASDTVSRFLGPMALIPEPERKLSDVFNPTTVRV
jgi:hypothetical protein